MNFASNLSGVAIRYKLMALDVSSTAYLIENNVATITNNGTAKVFPVLTANFSGSATYFKVMKGTRQVYIAKSFSVGDVLIIDNAKALVTANILRVMDTVDLTSTFFSLDPGGTVITFAPNANATVRVDFKEKWL
jgi:phage-related protein